MPADRFVRMKLDAHVHDRVMELAKAQNRSAHELMKEAVTQYVGREERREAGGRMADPESDREPASVFYERLSATFGTDIDLEAVIRESRPSPGEP